MRVIQSDLSDARTGTILIKNSNSISLNKATQTGGFASVQNPRI